jgi:hypothetical protein
VLSQSDDIRRHLSRDVPVRRSVRASHVKGSQNFLSWSERRRKDPVSRPWACAESPPFDPVEVRPSTSPLEVAVQNDVTYLAILLGLFVLMFGLIKVCDLIIGSDEAAIDDEGSGTPAPQAGTDGADETAVAA